jgi:hypothetical protein
VRESEREREREKGGYPQSDAMLLAVSRTQLPAPESERERDLG